MKATFYTVIKTQRNDTAMGSQRDKVKGIKAEGCYQGIPNNPDGMVVKVTMDIDEALLNPVEVSVKIGPEDLIDEGAIVGDLQALSKGFSPT